MLIEIPTNVSLEVRQLGEKAAEPLLMAGPTGAPWVVSEPLAKAFAQRYRVISFDYRGVGGSQRGEGPISVASLAEDAIAVLDALEVDRAHVLGWSLGSAIGQEMAIAHPDRVAGLVLWGTWAATDAHQRAVLTTLRHPWASGDLPAALAGLSLVFSPEYVNSPGFAAGLAPLLPAFPHTDVGMHAVVEQWDADLAHDARTRLGAISAPTLVVAGEQDMVTSPRLGQAVADAIPGARMELYTGPGASHAVGLERAAEFVPLVMGFLGRCRLDA